MIPEIEKGLKEVSLSLLDFEEIVCAKGPGSYTGVRIALTIAKIISQMSGAKLILVSSLMAMGNANKKYIALMNARSARSYIGIYDQGKVILEDTIKTNEEVKELIKEFSSFEVIGEGSYLGIEATLPNEVEGLLSWKELINPEEDVLKVKPVYLKDNYGI